MRLATGIAPRNASHGVTRASDNEWTNVPPEADIRANGISMAHFTGRLLEKIEELTLYTLEQEEQIAAQKDICADLLTRLGKLEAFIDE